jgi:hypothetical protein
MSFIYGSELANLQDAVFRKYKESPSTSWSEYTIDRISNNKWIKIATRFGPNNLVIRNHCLVDLLCKNQSHRDEILKLCHTLAPSGLWLEGYSYWIYTEPFLKAYEISSYTSPATSIFLKDFRTRVDKAFIQTAYNNSGVLYPAPFGDLRNISLATHLQTNTTPDAAQKHPVMKQLPRYYITPKPLGFNLHTNTKESVYVIDSGIPKKPGGEPFLWYKGYDKKYPTKMSEIRAMINFKRILSIIKGFK